MQEGSIRCDVNVSVHKPGEPFGTRSEMKNVNSFSAAVRGIDYEVNRQIELLESGGTVVQETRRWDDDKGISVSMRSKEDAQDYRYFPEPDLLTIVVDDERIQSLKDEIPELPNKKLIRYIKEFGLSVKEATAISENVDKARFYDECVSLNRVSPKAICNWLLGDIAKYENANNVSVNDTAITTEKLVDLIELIESGKISNAAGKTVFEIIIKENRDINSIIEEKSLAQVSDSSALEAIADEVLANNEKSVTDYKGGKTNALGFLVGQCMKASKGKANPSMMKEIILKKIEG